MLVVRRYEPGDEAGVWALSDAALDAVMGTHVGSGPWDDDLHDIEQVYLDNSGEFLVGMYGGQLVAMGALKRTTPERAEIKRMRVHPAYWRRGFGQAILTALERRAAELGYTVLHLDTTIQQEAAQHLYVKNGYQEVRQGKIGRFDSIFFEKSLCT
jgi:GNAT superfamily N-acetyltransferase